MSAKFRFILGDVRLSAWNFALQAYEMAALLPSLTIHHTCPCGTNWWDEWDCLCNDRCPTCDAEIEPDEHEAIQGANSTKIRTLNDRRWILAGTRPYLGGASRNASRDHGPSIAPWSNRAPWGCPFRLASTRSRMSPCRFQSAIRFMECSQILPRTSVSTSAPLLRAASGAR